MGKELQLRGSVYMGWGLAGRRFWSRIEIGGEGRSEKRVVRGSRLDCRIRTESFKRERA